MRDARVRDWNQRGIILKNLFNNNGKFKCVNLMINHDNIPDNTVVFSTTRSDGG